MAGNTFWYKLLDLMQYGNLYLTSPARGYMELTKSDWAGAFYDGDSSIAAQRAWERFKRRAREERLFTDLPGDEDESATNALTSTRPTFLSERVVVKVGPTLDAVYFALGAPHPAGIAAQIRCERERRRDLLPLVVRGIAAAAHVEQRRMVG